MVHLHNHSEFSLLDGAIKVEDLARRAKELGQPAVALTDHGVLHGAINFYKACKEYGVKPIIGNECYMIYGHGADVKACRSSSHITILAQNSIGYHNLVKLTSWSHLHGMYYKPRITKEKLKEHSEGLICLSGCIQSEVNHFILNNDYRGGEELAAYYKDIFGDRYFLEVHNHSIHENNRELFDKERAARAGLFRIAKTLNIKVVATNDCHFLNKDDHAAHNVLLCIGKAQRLNDPKRMEYSPDLYFKSREEMEEMFTGDVLDNTILVSEMVGDYGIAFGDIKYPKFPLPKGRTSSVDFLWEICDDGLHRRYGNGDHASRLQYELDVIQKAGFVDYFLIIWDIIKYAKENSVPVGPGRGSAASSLVAYCLGITDVDPVSFGLVFERFLNPDRVSMPDIDLDFCMDRRNEVINYVRRVYGETSVAQIITFGSLAARSVIRDVARVMDWDHARADHLAKLVPADVGITLDQAAEKEKEIREILEKDSSATALWHICKKLEGLSRHAGVHAAGIVISDRPLDEIIPLCRSKDKEVISQYDMKVLGDLGLLKMDFLGLRTLTVIDKCVQLATKPFLPFNIGQIPMDDQAAFDIYNRGETVGIFQMESPGITSCCKRWGVTSIDDIVAIGAIYRPGPMIFLDEYIARKHGKGVEYLHPLLKEACQDTFGIMIYQEQVMKAATLLAGYTLGQSDILRRAMGKKDRKEMEKERKRFIKGCKKVNDIPEPQAEEIFGFIARFAEYGFNKSHAVAYGLISYQTAYLKAHYPLEFMTALLIHDTVDIERLGQVIAECKRMGIKILPPDVNKSDLFFTPTSEGIRFGLSSILNIGPSAIEKVAEAKRAGPFVSLVDFFTRISKSVGKTVSDAFAKSGTFDCFGSSRSQLLEEAANALEASRSSRKDFIRDQMPLFDLEVTTRPTAPVRAWSRGELLAYEKEYLGYYISGHPLEEFTGYFNNPKVNDISSVKRLTREVNIKIVGVVDTITKKYTKASGKPFYIVKIEDYTGSTDVFVFGEVFQETKNSWKVGSVVGIRATVKPKDDRVMVSVNKLALLRPWVS